VCYPSAPIDVLRQKSKVQTPEQKLAAAEKAQAKEEREAKKKAVGIWNPDGTELKVKSSWSNYAETIKTERTAQIWATDALLDLENWKAKRNDPKWAQDDLDAKITRIEENSEKVIAALAAKRGVSADVVRAELEIKAAKKRKSQGW
jgi:ribosome-binding protein aMBF1 (putative translation factor)